MKLHPLFTALLWGGICLSFQIPKTYGQGLVSSNNQPIQMDDPLIEEYNKPEMIGTAAPEIHLQTIDGRWFTLDINLKPFQIMTFRFLYIHCGPCKADKPVLNSLAEKFKNDDRVPFIHCIEIEAFGYSRIPKKTIRTPIHAEGYETIKKFHGQATPPLWSSTEGDRSKLLVYRLDPSIKIDQNRLWTN